MVKISGLRVHRALRSYDCEPRAGATTCHSGGRAHYFPVLADWASGIVENLPHIQSGLEHVRLTAEPGELDRARAELNRAANLPRSWQAAMAQWRGVYLIMDRYDGKSYVGSAYGKDNILGRWNEYSTTGHGGNAELKGRNPVTFQFSILERLSPDMPADDVIQLEANWKNRLGTRECGLNKN